MVIAEELVKGLPDRLIVGSLRRGCEVVGDVDLLTTSQEAMGLLLMLVDEVFVKGHAKVSARKGGIQVSRPRKPAGFDAGDLGGFWRASHQ